MTARRRTPAKPARRTAARSTRRPSAVPAGERRASGSGVAPGMQAINSYLAVADVAASAQFLEDTFGFTRGVTLPGTDGQLRYAEMRHGDAVLILVPKGDDTSPSAGAPGLYTYVPDVDVVLSKAREAGADAGEAEDKPWGDRVAVVIDPDGYRWLLATFKKLAPFSQS